MWSKHPKGQFDWYEGVRYLFFRVGLLFAQNVIQTNPERAKRGERFGIAMIGWAKTADASAVIDGELRNYWLCSRP